MKHRAYSENPENGERFYLCTDGEFRTADDLDGFPVRGYTTTNRALRAVTTVHHRMFPTADDWTLGTEPEPTAPEFLTTCSACGDDLDTCNDPGAHRRGTCTFCDDPSATLCEACSDDLQRHPVRVRTPRRTDDLDGWTGWGK